MVEIVTIDPPEPDSNAVHFGGAVSAQDGVARLLRQHDSLREEFRREGCSTVLIGSRGEPYSPADDNEADAIAILLWALETRGGVR